MIPLNEWMDNVGKRALCRKPTLWATYYMTRMLLDLEVPGDLVECGVFAGVHPAVMARACHDAGKRRLIWMFDTFAGIPPAGPEDGKEGKLIEGQAVCSMRQVESHMKDWGVDPEMLIYVEGRFEDTTPKWSDTARIALLRLDGDLYSSTAACLKNLEPRLSDNGILVIDDGLPGCRRAVAEHFGYRQDFAPLYWHKGQK